MGAGLVSGMGYLGYAVLYTVILALIMAGYVHLNLWEKKDTREKTLTITIPEDLDYTSVFDDLFDTYTDKWELSKVKTTNMGKPFQAGLSADLKGQQQGKRNDRRSPVQKR